MQRVQTVFSAEGTSHTSSGVPAKLHYDETFSNIGGAWDEDSTFTAPEDGDYLVTLSFVKEPVLNAAPPDDIFMVLRVNGLEIGRVIGSGADGRTRGFTMTLSLKRGARVETLADSRSGKLRRLRQFSFTGMRVEP